MSLAVKIKVQGLQIFLEDEMDELGLVAEVHKRVLVLQPTACHLPCPETLYRLAQAIHPLGRGGFRDFTERLEADVREDDVVAAPPQAIDPGVQVLDQTLNQLGIGGVFWAGRRDTAGQPPSVDQ